MKTKHLKIFCALTLFASCEVIPPDFGVFVPEGERTAFVRKTSVISHTSTQVIYDVEFQILERYLELDYGALFEEDVLRDQNTTIENFEFFDFNNDPVDEVVLLIDQSGSYEDTDPHNARTQVINKFVHEFEGNDLSVGGFSREGALTSAPIEYLSSSDVSEHAITESLFSLALRTGGQSNFYDALYAALGNFTANGDKHLVVLVQHNDQGSVATAASVIAEATNKNISINIIALGENAPVSTLSSISQQTGGFFAVCNSDKEMISMLSNLNKVLNGSSNGYKMRVRWTPGVTLSSGVELVQPLQTVYFHDLTPFNKLYSFIKIP